MSAFDEPGEDSDPDDYQSGPWARGHRYFQPDPAHRLHEELTDLSAWLSPTAEEAEIRFLVVTRFSTAIEHCYPGCYVIPQGSTATATWLPTSDIDLIVFNLPTDLNPIVALRTITKLFHRSRMISRGFVLDHASVPIAKLIERPFGFSIDICIENINGALMIPRVARLMQIYPLFYPLLMFLKLFVYTLGIDDPAKGGFGSSHLINVALFAIQSNPTASNTGDLLLNLIDVIANQLNLFFVGLSTVEGGRLISKPDRYLLTHKCPQAFVVEDPQFHGRFLGARTDSSIRLKEAFQIAREALNSYDFLVVSGIFAFIHDFEPLLERRRQLCRFAEALHRSVEAFAAEADAVPTLLTKRDVEAMAKHPKLGEDQSLKSLKNAKKKHKAKEKKAKEKLANLNFHAGWVLAREEHRKHRQEIRGHTLQSFKGRQGASERFVRCGT
jgi:non-canonical poly(A) RNA polymerase PAPD5/7